MIEIFLTKQERKSFSELQVGDIFLSPDRMGAESPLVKVSDQGAYLLGTSHLINFWKGGESVIPLVFEDCCDGGSEASPAISEEDTDLLESVFSATNDTPQEEIMENQNKPDEACDVGDFVYTLVRTGASSDKYGSCEICGEFAADVYLQRREARIDLNPIHGRKGRTYRGCSTLFGHKECLLRKRMQ